MARILVIDDEKLVRFSIREILEGEGHDVVEACDGEEGLEKFDCFSTDLVIADIMMPNKDGIETIVELKDDTPDAQIIAISGGGSVPDIAPVFLEMAQILGADNVLRKPVQKTELLKAVNRCLLH